VIVDFMLVGSQESGTSFLAAKLGGHPEVCFSRPKELHYFGRNVDWRTGLDEYHRHFDANPGQLCGEGSVTYAVLPNYAGTAERLHEYNRSLKVIYLMRDPGERIRSHPAHRYARRNASANVDRKVLAAPSYLNHSRYAVQLRPYLELSGRSQVLPLVFEEMIADLTATLAAAADFLSIEPEGFDLVANEAVNVST
jgi:hypothetical protein